MKSLLRKFIFVLPFIFSSSALACSVCFSGLADPSQLNAVKWGVLTLLFIVTFVVGGFAAFFLSLWKKTRGAHS